MALAVPLLISVVLWLTGCATTPVERTSRSVGKTSGALPLSDEPRRAGFELVLLFMPDQPTTREVRAALQDELHDDFDVVTATTGDDVNAQLIADALAKLKPRCIVLLDNRVVEAYRRYQRTTSGVRFPPAVVLMATFLPELLPTLQNAVGVSYEVPGVIGFTYLRELLQQPVQRVGVVYRGLLEPLIARERALAQRERIELVSEKVSSDPEPTEVREALARLSSGGAHALWVLNDSRLLSKDLLEGAWLPYMRHNELPVLVGVRPLVNPTRHFGTLALVPDHQALGVQAADLIYDLVDKDWQVRSDAHPPLSVMTVLDKGFSREHLQLRPNALERVDSVVE